MSARDLLLELLADGSDIELVFRAADDTTEVVPAHSLTLRLWSAVLREAIKLKSSDISGKIRIPMTDTSKEDWLMAMEYLYPVTPQPVTNWDNLEPMLALADKYCMPALIQRLGAFLKHKIKKLELSSSSKLFVWKWIYVADRYGLGDMAKQCIDAQTDLHGLVHSGPMKQSAMFNGHQLSAATLQHLVVAI